MRYPVERDVCFLTALEASVFAGGTDDRVWHGAGVQAVLQDDSAVLLRCCRVGEGRGVKGRYEKSQIAGQEYTGITVYRNTPISGAFVKPTWW